VNESIVENTSDEVSMHIDIRFEEGEIQAGSVIPELLITKEVRGPIHHAR
jgi:hypothetical protein